MKRWLFIFLIPLFFSSCQHKETLEGFDDKAWKEDPNACKNQRSELVKILISKKEQLKKLDDDAIAALLGPPERNRQFARGKKNYIYFIYSGGQCIGDSVESEGKKLVIEFDPVGMPRMIRESYLDF